MKGIAVRSNRSLKKVLMITNIPTHYKVALLNHVNEQLVAVNVDFRVYFVAMSHKRRQNWGHTIERATFPWDMVKKIRIAYFDFITNLGIILKEERPDLVIISGNVNFYALQISVKCRRLGIPHLIYSGVSSDRICVLNSGPKERILGMVRQAWRKFLFNNCDGFIVHGKKHAEYARIMTHKKNIPITIAFNTVDITRFLINNSKVTGRFPEELRGYDSSCKLFYCGNLLKDKGIDLVLKALAQIKELNFTFFLLGAGNYKNELMRLIDFLGLEDKVVFWGEVPPEEVVPYYCMADIFITGTLHDIWGLVINEAMAAGLPVIASKYAVAANELVTDFVTGFVIDPQKTDEFSERIRLLITDEKLRKRMGENARQFAKENLLVSDSAGKVVEAIKNLINFSEK